MTSWIFTNRSSSVAAETASWNETGRDSAANKTQYLTHGLDPRGLCSSEVDHVGLYLLGTEQHTDNVRKVKYIKIWATL